MAYCKKCGAYIPDGQTRCLACGYDEAGENAASQYAYAYDEESARRDYEAEREKKQQQNREWAKEEYARRRQEREEEEARKKAEAEARAARRNYDPSRQSEAGMSYTEGNSKFFAAASYISLGFLLQKMFLPDDEYAQYHAKQGERLFICSIIAELIGNAFGIGWIVVLLRIGYIWRGVANAKNGDETELPYINRFFNKKK